MDPIEAQSIGGSKYANKNIWWSTVWPQNPKNRFPLDGGRYGTVVNSPKVYPLMSISTKLPLR